MLGAVVWGHTGCTPADRKDDFESFPIGGPVSVYDVHTGVVDAGDRVSLEGVVAVLPRTPDDDFFMVQAPEGGEYAGLEVFLHHALPSLHIVPGDRLTVSGLLTSRSGRIRLIVDELSGVEITGSTEVPPTVVRSLSDWEPYNGVVVSPGPTELLDCGRVAGAIQTDQDFTLDLTYLPTVTVVGTGILDEQFQGVVSGIDHAWSLLPRSEDELGGSIPTEGCPTSIEAARARAHEGRLALPDVIVTAGNPSGDIVFVQDPGASSGLEVHAEPGAFSELAIGQAVSIAGLLPPPNGPRMMYAHVLTPGSDASSTSPWVTSTDDPFDPTLDGALVDLGVLQVFDAGVVGRRSTEEGIELADTLLDGDRLPDDGAWSLIGQLRVDVRDDPPSALLLPRSAADWSPAP